MREDTELKKFPLYDVHPKS
ncbi:TPA: hypothetical protein ACXXJW_003046 [Enterococcus faecium]